jgi:hypothetical protein
MSLAQKFRGFITSTAPAAALATLLTVIPAFNNNATAQEPRATTVSTSAPAAIPPELQKRMDKANEGITKNIEEARYLADQAGRAARGEIIDGKESEHTSEARARSHSVKHPDEAGFFIIEGKNSAMSGEKVEQTILARFSKNNATAKPFRDPDKGESTVIGIYVRGELVGIYGLNKSAIKGVDEAAELVKNPPLKVSANAPRLEH